MKFMEDTHKSVQRETLISSRTFFLKYRTVWGSSKQKNETIWKASAEIVRWRQTWMLLLESPNSHYLL